MGRAWYEPRACGAPLSPRIVGRMLRVLSLVACLSLVAACAGTPAVPPVDPAVADVAARSQAFVAALTPEQRAVAARPFDDRERTQWAFVPGRYAGVEFGDLSPAADAAMRALLRALLGTEGLRKTLAIVQLEELLRALESQGGRDASHRDPRRYAVLVCGDIAPRGRFAVRVQGHHVSLHFTFLDGRLVGATPHFLGSNPHERRDGDRAGERVLAAEEDLARELLATFTAEQRISAILAPVAPPDVLLGPAAAADALGLQKGLNATVMDERQQALLWRLVEAVVRNLRPEFAESELRRYAWQRPTLHFAWMGGERRGDGHYWRVQGVTFAIEYDNTQNDANHVHVVWRDEDRDFGRDPLRAHLERDHR
jgi:hypothetical protein